MFAKLGSMLGGSGSDAAEAKADDQEGAVAQMTKRLSGMWGADDPTTAANKWKKHKALRGKRGNAEKLASACFLKDHKMLSFPAPRQTDADTAYDEAEAAFVELEERLIAAGDELVAFQGSLVPYVAGMSAGARAFAAAGALNAAVAPAGSGLFSASMSASEDALRTKLADALESTIMPSVLRKAAAMEAVWQKCAERHTLKMNADYYEDKFEKLEAAAEGKEISDSQQQRLDSNKEKSEQATKALRDASDALMAVLKGYRDFGSAFLRREFELLKTAQKEAFSAVAAEMAQLDSEEVKALDLPLVGGGTIPVDSDGGDDENDDDGADGGAAPPPLPPPPAGQDEDDGGA